MLLLMMTIVDDVYDGVVDADDDDYGHHSQRFSPCDPLLCHPRRYEEDFLLSIMNPYHLIMTISIYLYYHIYI